VPILRAGRVVGVLTVQNRARRGYAEDEIEAMQIIASLLAEMFGSGALIVFARARKGRDEEARLRYGRLESLAEAVLLFFLVILMAEAILPKYF